MPKEENDPLAYDPEEFEHIPKGPSPREQQPPTKFDDEWKNHKALIHVLISQAVPAERITDVTTSHPWDTLEDLATINARLFQLGEQHGIPRKYLLKEVERISKRAEFCRWSTEDANMSWLKNADDGIGAPELSAPLPKKDQPLSGKPEMPEMSGAADPKPPMGKGMPGIPGKSPTGAPGGDANEVKSLLDKGDLKAALEALKKLVGEPGKPKQAPFLGKPKPELGAEKTEAPAAPKLDGESAIGDGEIDPKRSCMACGNCGIVLEASCPTCEGNLQA